MCSICDDLKTKKIDSKEAFKRIGDALQKADTKTTRHLMSLSDTILDNEVPMSEKDEDLEKKWHEENHED
jgi:hypothetical protein